MVLFVALAGCGSVPADVAGVIEMHASEHFYPESLAEMATASDLVVVGEVVSVEPGRIMEGEAGTGDGRIQVLIVSVAPEETVLGDSNSAISFEILGREITASGEPGRAVVVNGLHAPKEGERYLLFLTTEGSGGTHGLVSYDGLLRIVDDRISTTLAGEGRVAHDLSGTPVSQVLALMPSK
jgi:hypothetical protein